ncbi:oxygenase MpaB family protein [Amycolatopsis sp. NPDC049868]|uniref:oxygenase MpaB family protein n=1 Tax=Amycolatopsis sp. NPDC049868 TaxID=3363934 RepID=UPI0037BDACC1
MGERLPDPELFRQGGFRVASRLFIEGDIRGDEHQVARLRQFAQREDPAADVLVPLLRKGGQPKFELALRQGIDSVESPPEELEAFFRNVEATPYWVDRDRLDRGARAITRAGLLGLFPLGDVSLMGGYLASRATKSLVGTGEIEYKAARRLVETATWWIHVTTPGALVPGGRGYESALRVRIVHAHVRAAMNRRKDWDYAAWDRPVNQVQTAGTLLLFSLVYVFGTQLLGLRYSARERADILHLWRYVGWLMGVDEELLPAGEDDAWRLLWLLATTEFIPDDDSKRLAAALMKAHAGIGDGRGALGKVLAHVSVAGHGAISRLLLGKTNADFLELPDDPLAQAAVVAVAGVNFAAETVRRVVPGATALQELIGAAGRRHYLRQVTKVFGLDPTYGRHMKAA